MSRSKVIELNQKTDNMNSHQQVWMKAKQLEYLLQ